MPFLEGFNKDNKGEVFRKRRFSKFFIWFSIFAFAVFLFGWGVARYSKWQDNKDIQTFVETLDALERESYERAMADTFGGKTPQETLRMYIEAVEAGDYELASKYFIEGKRSFWVKELRDIDNSGTLEIFIQPLKEAIDSDVHCSADSIGCSIYDPVGIDFIKYPNGIWKLVDI